MARTKYYQLRLTEDEYSQLKDNAKDAGITVAEYIRHATLRMTPEQATALFEVTQALNKVLRELRRQGTNLNQLATIANTYSKKSEREVVDWINKELIKNEDAFENLTDTAIAVRKILDSK